MTMARLSSPDTLSLALSEAPCPDPGSPEHLVSRRQVLDRVTSLPGPARYEAVAVLSLKCSVLA